MSLLELVKARRSVRTFSGDSLTKEDREALFAYAQSDATQDNPCGQKVTWKLLEGFSSPVIVGTDLFLAGKMPQAPDAELAFGFVMEKVVLKAQAMGIGTTWIAGTMDRPAFEKAVELSEGEVMPCVTPLGYPAKNMSLRETMMRKGVKAETRMGFGEIFFDGDFAHALTPDKAGILTDAFEAVRFSPSAVNKQPWRLVLDRDTVHFYEVHSRGYVSESGWDVQKIDIGIAMLHLDCALKELGKSVTWFKAAQVPQAGENTDYIISLKVQ